MPASPPPREPSYEVFDAIASGGMAVVHLGRRRGAAGFARVVAVKRLHAHLAADPDLVTMLLDEARLSARVRHRNVVSVLDVVEDGGPSLVMEYVHGAALAQLVRAASALGERVPPAVASAIAIDTLSGLHAAHEATGEDGAPLHLVHRDVSPQNIMVGADGAARIVDFGVAKARVRAHVTREGTLKGKLAYMAPEQFTGQATRRTDVLAAGIVLWEMLAGRRLHDDAVDDLHLIGAITMSAPPPLAPFAPSLPQAVSDVVDRALRKAPEERFATAEEMAAALREALPPAPPSEVGAWVTRLVGDKLAERAALIARIERGEHGPTSAPERRGSVQPPPDERTTVPDGRPTVVDPPLRGSVTETRGTVTLDPLARRGETDRRERTRRRWWLVVAAVVTLGAAAGLQVARGRDGSPAEAGPSTAEAPTPGIQTAATPSDTGSAEAPPPVEPSASAAPDASAEPSSSARSTPPAGRSRWKGAPAPNKATLATKPGCDPPWEQDASGIKRIKKGCLQ